MATIYLAVDDVTGLTLPNGQIKGLSDSEQGLRDAGFDATTYTGNRLGTIDDAAPGWDDDVVPGWYLVDASVMVAIPPTDLDDLQDAIFTFQTRVVGWYEQINALAVGQPTDRVVDGRRRLYEALGALYLFCTDTGNSLTNRKLFATNMSFGALDITKAEDFYATSVPVLTGNEPARPADNPAAQDWHCWVDPTNVGTRLNLAMSATISGIVPASVALLGTEWVTDITA